MPAPASTTVRLACETCRSRKQKCDEQRPKCGLCQRMKLECNWREVQPTKKDKTLVEILDRLRSLETKVDRIPTSRGTSVSGFGPPQPSPASQPSFNPDVDPSSYSSSLRPSPSGIKSNQSYRHFSASHKILTWPIIQQALLQALPSNVGDLKTLEQDGTAFLVQIQRETPNLPLDEGLTERPFVGMQTQATRISGGVRTTFPPLTQDVMNNLASAYFDTFNFIYPFMDRQNFISDTLSKVHSEGFDGDIESVIALLVFALGELAIDGSRGKPIEFYKGGRPSGVRGGSATRPPGIALFNEARKRIGFCLTECELENVQIFSLAASSIDWNSPRGDLIKRAYWHCFLMEWTLYLELDVPLTGISALQDRVGIPSFNTPFCEADHRGNQSSHFEAHYASQIALRRLCANMHNNIYESTASTDTPGTSNNGDFGGPSATSLNQLASQLSQWRSMLPRDLQWDEDDPASFPSPQASGGYNQPLDPTLSPQRSRPAPPLFTTDLNSDPVHYPYVYDIQVALLRTRYYYAKYMVHRPFVYKALHFPEQMTQEDAQGVAECLRHFLGILLIMHMTQINPMLRDIRTQLCGARFEAEVNESVDLMLDWIQDLKSSDAIAKWCYRILQPMYNLEP
ncbi:hypothetical protein BGZ57DRAFT_945050 [Hyaloscypha finlandica]|nr:hypothetical protein BGZ57DRAFT_945050 [Hyaloscypha finlandica]